MIRCYTPKLKAGDLIEVHGWVMLNKIEAGRYRIDRIGSWHGNEFYAFTRPKGKKTLIRHFVNNVDPWLREAGDPDLNKIVKT